VNLRFPFENECKDSCEQFALIIVFNLEGEYLSGGTEILLNFIEGVDGSSFDSTFTPAL